jgi:hypothetical protein
MDDVTYFKTVISPWAGEVSHPKLQRRQHAVRLRFKPSAYCTQVQKLTGTLHGTLLSFNLVSTRTTWAFRPGIELWTFIRQLIISLRYDCHTSRAVSVTGISPRRDRFDPRSVRVEFIVDKVVLEHVFLRGLHFSSVSIFLPIPYIITSPIFYLCYKILANYGIAKKHFPLRHITVSR